MTIDGWTLPLSIGRTADIDTNSFKKAIQNGLSDHYIKVDDSDFPFDLTARMAEIAVHAFLWPSDFKRTIPGYKQYTADGIASESMQFSTETALLLEALASESGRTHAVAFGQNQWPDLSRVGTEFRNVVEQYLYRMRSLYREVLRRLESALELPHNTLIRLDSAFAEHRLAIVKTYPPEGDTVPVDVGQEGSGWLALVSELDGPSLRIRLGHDEVWRSAQLDSCYGLNIGKVFAEATFGAFHATRYQFKVDSLPRHSIVYQAGLPRDLQISSLQAIFSRACLLQ